MLAEIATPLIENVSAPYRTALWKIWDLCGSRMEQLRASDEIYGPEADTIEEIVKVLIRVPALLPRPPVSAADDIGCGGL